MIKLVVSCAFPLRRDGEKYYVLDSGTDKIHVDFYSDDTRFYLVKYYKY